MEHRQKRDIQETINEMQRQVFESQGVQGAYGIQFLSKVKKVHGQDAVLLTAFYEFVQVRAKHINISFQVATVQNAGCARCCPNHWGVYSWPSQETAWNPAPQYSNPVPAAVPLFQCISHALTIVHTRLLSKPD